MIVLLVWRPPRAARQYYVIILYNIRTSGLVSTPPPADHGLCRPSRFGACAQVAGGQIALAEAASCVLFGRALVGRMCLL